MIQLLRRNDKRDGQSRYQKVYILDVYLRQGMQSISSWPLKNHAEEIKKKSWWAILECDDVIDQTWLALITANVNHIPSHMLRSHYLCLVVLCSAAIGHIWFVPYYRKDAGAREIPVSWKRTTGKNKAKRDEIRLLIFISYLGYTENINFYLRFSSRSTSS